VHRTAAELVPYVKQGMADALNGESAKPTLGLERLLVAPIPLWKRTMDIIGATVGLLIFAPVLIAIAIAIKLTSSGPVIFTQRRAGLGGRPFQICKFRTMGVDAEAKKQALRAISEQDGPAFKLTNDPRVTRIGKILRKTSLDELPQFWNVLKGDMSLVGPRPLPIDEQNGVEQWQRARLETTPGLTCIWQIKGRSQVSFADWVRMDMNYLRRRTLWHDLKILVQTVPAVLLRKGAR
jgi:lipopolysaccharide/colanic/teichoic acid biosynthesis glycosyltransferase